MLQADVGVRPQIGCNVVNGRLANVNVLFDSASVGRLSVSDLAARGHKALAVSLKEQPAQVTVAVRSQPTGRR